MSVDQHMATLKALADKPVMTNSLSNLNGTSSKEALEILAEGGTSGQFTIEDIATLADVPAEKLYGIFRLAELTPPSPMDPAVASVMSVVYGAICDEFTAN